jgi:hypothetical protein
MTSGLASSLSAMQSLGGFHSMATAAGIPHHHLMASAAAMAAAGASSRDVDQTDLSGHHLGTPISALGVPHEYHHL